MTWEQMAIEAIDLVNQTLNNRPGKIDNDAVLAECVIKTMKQTDSLRYLIRCRQLEEKE